ncbi:uncharacterized protein ACIBXB_009909 [Morphnus guianensis]
MQRPGGEEEEEEEEGEEEEEEEERGGGRSRQRTPAAAGGAGRGGGGYCVHQTGTHTQTHTHSHTRTHTHPRLGGKVSRERPANNLLHNTAAPPAPRRTRGAPRTAAHMRTPSPAVARRLLCESILDPETPQELPGGWGLLLAPSSLSTESP